MIELTKQVWMIEPDADEPTGVIVGSAVIEKVIPPNASDGESGLFRRSLSDIKCLAKRRKPTRHPRPK